MLSNASAQQQQATANKMMPGNSQNSTDVLSGIDGMNQTPTAVSPPQDSGNWLTRLLPTIGGIAAPVIGGLLAPETGGLSLLAGLALAGGGSAAGKAAENAIENKDIGNNVLESGVEGGVGQLVGAGIGKVVGGVGKAIGGVANKGLEAEKVAQAGADAVNAAKATKLNYGGISSKLQNDLKLGSNQELVGQLGFDKTNPYDMQKVAQAGQAINQKYSDALLQTGPVNMEGFTNSIYNTLKSSGSTDLTASPIGKALSAFESPGTGITRELTPSMSASDVRSLQQEIGTQIGNTQRIVNNANLQGTVNTSAEADLNSLHKLYDELGSKIKTPELNEVIANQTLDDPERAALVAQHGEALGNQIADTVNNANNAEDYLKPMQQFTQMNHASKMAIDDIENVTGSARAEQRAKFAADGGVVTPDEVANINPTDVAAMAKNPIMTLASKALTLGSQGGKAGKAAEGLGSLLQRIAPVVGTGTGQLLGNSPNYVAPASAETGLSMQNNGIGANGNALGDILNSKSTAAIPIQQLLRLQENGGGYNVPVEMSQWATPAASALKQMTAASSAEKQLQSLISLYDAAGGAQGTAGGLLSQLGGMFTGGPAGQYGAQAGQLAQQISKLTDTPINVPSLTMNPEAAQGVLAQMQAALSAYGG